MIKYRLTTPEYNDEILKFLREQFYPDEPLVNASNPPGKEIQDELVLLSYLANEPSTCIAALNGDQLIGVILGGPKNPGKEQLMLEEAAQFPGTKWAQILEIMATLEREANVFDKFKVDKVFHGHLLSVHRDFRTKGIGRELFQKSMERAKELDYAVYDCFCTNWQSAALAEKLGCECIHELRFEDYREPGNDKQVLFPPMGHEVIKAYAKLLV